MEIDELTGSVIECVFKVHSTLGPGFLETVYKNALLIELKHKGIQAVKETGLTVMYEGEIVGSYYADLIVDGRLILELKAVSKLEVIHELQLVNYLRATGMETGLLINFGGRQAEVRRKFRKGIFQKEITR
jgi:GxxExxY protein